MPKEEAALAASDLVLVAWTPRRSPQAAPQWAVHPTHLVQYWISETSVLAAEQSATRKAASREQGKDLRAILSVEHCALSKYHRRCPEFLLLDETFS